MNEQQIRDSERLQVLKELRETILNISRGTALDRFQVVVDMVTSKYHAERIRQGIPRGVSSTPRDPNSNRQRDLLGKQLFRRMKDAPSVAERDTLVAVARDAGVMNQYMETWLLEAGA